MQITPPGGGAGSDTTAVHYQPGAENPEGSGAPVFLAGDVVAMGEGSFGTLFAYYGARVIKPGTPTGLTAVVDTTIPVAGPYLPAGVHTYQLAAQDAQGNSTLACSAVSVTCDGIHAVRLSWDDGWDGAGANPAHWTPFRDSGALGSVQGRSATFVDDGGQVGGGNDLPLADTTGGLVVDAGITAHGHPVPEAGAIATETITPNKTLILTVDGVAYKVPAVLA